MRIPGQNERASVTLVALCFTIVLAISLSSYLTLCYRSYNLSTRLLHEDKARQLAQVGLEEALWALNQSNWAAAGPASSTAWTISGASRTVSLTYNSLGQGATGTLALTVLNYANVGPVTWPTITSSATITLDSGQIVNKTLQATTKASPLFANAVAAATGSVSFAAGGTADSYDSSIGAYGGANIGSVAVIAGTNVTITNALINGYAATYGNAISYGTGKIKTTLSAVMDFNRISKSAFIPVSTINEPNESIPGNYTGRLTGSTQSIGTPGGPTEYWYTEQFWGSTDLNLDSGETLTVNGPVKVRIYNDIEIQNTGKINVTPTGRLELYVGDDVSISGSGEIKNNSTGDYPKNVALFSTTSWNGSRTFTYSSTAEFRGVILSTAAQVMTFSSNAVFYGAILSSAHNITFSGGNPTIHYDTALRNLPKNWVSNVSTPFIINQLTEI